MESSAKAAGTGDPLALAIRLTKALRHASRTPVLARGIRWSWTVLSRVSASIAELLALLDRPDKESLLMCPTFRSHIAGFHRFVSGIRSAELCDDEFLVNFALRLATFYRQQTQKHRFGVTSHSMKTLDRITSACFELVLGAMSRHPENLDLFVNCRDALSILLTNDPVPAKSLSMSHSAIPDFSSGILTESSMQLSLNWAPGQRTSSFTDMEGLTASPSLRNDDVYSRQMVIDKDNIYQDSDDGTDDDDNEEMEDAEPETSLIDVSETCIKFQLRHLGCSRLLQICSGIIRPELNLSVPDVMNRLSVVSDTVKLLLLVTNTKTDDIMKPALELLSNALSAFDLILAGANSDDLLKYVQTGSDFAVVVTGLLKLIECCSSPRFALHQRVLTSTRILRSFISPHAAVIDDLISLTEFPQLSVKYDSLPSGSDSKPLPWILSLTGIPPVLGESSIICNRILLSIAASSKVFAFATYDTLLLLVDQAGGRDYPVKGVKLETDTFVPNFSTESLLKSLLGVDSNTPDSSGESLLNYFDILSLLSVMTIHASEADLAYLDIISLLQVFVKFLCLLLSRLPSDASASVFQNFSQKTIDLLFGMSTLMTHREDFRSANIMELVSALSSRHELTDDMRFNFIRSLLNSNSEWVYDIPSYPMQFIFRISSDSVSVRSQVVNRLMRALSNRLEKSGNRVIALMSSDTACIFLLSLFSEPAERQGTVSQLLHMIVQKTNLSFASVINQVDSTWTSLLFLANLSVQYLRATALNHSKIASCCAFISKAPELDVEGIGSLLASFITIPIPDLSHCQGIANCDKYCDRLFHLLQDASQKIQTELKGDGSSPLLEYRWLSFRLIDSMLGLLASGCDSFSARYENIAEQSTLLDYSSPVTAHFIQQCAFRMRLGAEKLLPPDPAMWLLDSLDSVSRLASQNPASIRWWWIHLGVDVTINALSHHLLHDDTEAHLPETFTAVLFRLLTSFSKLLRTCVNDLRKARQASPGEEGELGSAINTSLEFGITTKELSELPKECTRPLAILSSKDSWSPSVAVWTATSYIAPWCSASDSLGLWQLRRLQAIVLSIMSALRLVLTTWPAVCFRQRTVAFSTLKNLVGSRIEPLGQASQLLMLFQTDVCETDIRAQESSVRLSHVHSILHDVSSNLMSDSISDRLSRLAVDCVAYLRKQPRVALTSFYMNDSEEYAFTDIVVLFLRGDPSVSHEALRLILILTEQASQSSISNKFRSAFLNFSGNNNAVAALVQAPTFSNKVSATKQRIREQCWTLLRRFLACHDEDPGRFLFCSETAKISSSLVESLLVEGVSSSAMYSAVSIMCRSSTPETSLTVLSRLLPIACNRSAICALDALDETLEFSCSVPHTPALSDESACFQLSFPSQCAGILPESGACYLYYQPDSSPIELCSFCVRHCYASKVADVAYFSPNSPQLSRKQCLCKQKHEASSYPHSHRLPFIKDLSVISTLTSSLEQFISSRIDLIGVPTSRPCALKLLQISSYLLPGSLATPSSGQQVQPIIPPAESAETTAIYRQSVPTPASFAVIGQADPLLVIVENCCINVYQNWKPNTSGQVKLCSSTAIPFRILGVYSQGGLVFVHGARDAHVLKFDNAGKRVKRIRPDLILEVLEAAAQSSVCILSAKWFTEVPRLLVVTNAGALVFDFSNDNSTTANPIYTSMCEPNTRVKDATIWKNRHVYGVSDSGSILVDDIIDGMGQLHDAGLTPPVSGASEKDRVFPAQSHSGPGVSIHMSNTTRKLVVTWSLSGTRLFNVDQDGNITTPVILHTPSQAVTNDIRMWIDVAGAHNLIIGIAPECTRVVALKVSDGPAEAWSRSIQLADRGRRCLGAVDISPNIKTASVLFQQENGSYSLLSSETDIAEPELVSVPCFQSFLDAPDPSSSRTTGSGGGECVAWTYRDVTIFERSKCVSSVPIQGSASSKDFVRDIAKSTSGMASEDPKSFSIAIEPDITPGHCVVAIRVLVDRSPASQSIKITLPALKRSIDISVASGSPKRYYDIVLSRFESAQITSLRDRVEVRCQSETSPITALSAIEVYSMPRSLFFQSTSVASLCSQHQHWPWPLSSQPESIADFPNETLLASGLRLCLTVCYLSNGTWNSMKPIISRVLSVTGKPCFNRLDSLFHLLLMEVVPHLEPPQFPEVANCLHLCGCSGLRMLLSWRHLHAQSDFPSINAGRQLMEAIDDSLAALGKSTAAKFGTFLCSCPTFFRDLIDVASKMVLALDACHVYHFPALLSSLFEFICEASLAIAQGDAPEEARLDLMQYPMNFMAACISCDFAAVRDAAQARLLASFASQEQQTALKASKTLLESSASPKPNTESVVSLSSDNDGSAADHQQQQQPQQHQQQRMTTIFNSAVRSVPGTRYRCDLCDTCPIIGPRYHCAHPDCVDFDLCAACYGAGDFVGSTHRTTHDVMMIPDNSISQRQPHISISGPSGANVRLARRRSSQH